MTTSPIVCPLYNLGNHAHGSIFFGGGRRDAPSTNVDNLPTEQYLGRLGSPNSVDDDLTNLVNVGLLSCESNGSPNVPAQ